MKAQQRQTRNYKNWEKRIKAPYYDVNAVLDNTKALSVL